jgi:hypothetical protein
MNMLTPIEPCGSTADGHIKWRYACVCGNITEVSASRVRNGYTRSCGCLINANPSNLRHGYRKNPTYSSWSSARNRANNPNGKDYARYGAVGIGFDKRWDVFENFLHDMGEKPRGTTLDRIDGAKGYGPSNCRWATPTEQARNRRCTVYVEVAGKVMPLARYAEQIGLKNSVAYMRMKRGTLTGVNYANT